MLENRPKYAEKTCFTLISCNLDEEKSIFQQLVMGDPLFKGKRWLFKNVFFIKYLILLSRSSGKKTKIKWLGPLTQRFDHKKVNKCKKFHFLTNLKLFWLWFFSQKISNINLLLGKKPKNAKKLVLPWFHTT